MSNLRTARERAGWSQSETARRLVELAATRGVVVAAPASLKSLISRWENGHAQPEQQYRELFVALYGRPAAELGLAAREPAQTRDGPARLRAALAAAAAVREGGAQPWQEQLALVTRLDDELGAAGAGELTAALVGQLERSLLHTVEPGVGRWLAGLLAKANLLAAAHERDQRRHDHAWQLYSRSRWAATEAGDPDGAAGAVAGLAATLVDAGEPTAALALIEYGEATLPTVASRHPRIGAVGPAAPVGAASPAASMAGTSAASPVDVESLAAELRVARLRLAAARAAATAATGDTDATRRALAPLAPGPVLDLSWRDPPVIELADLHRWRGHALAVLGDDTAAAPLQQALDAGPRGVRARAELHADLATTLAEVAPDEARAHAERADRIAEAISAERLRR